MIYYLSIQLLKTLIKHQTVLEGHELLKRGSQNEGFLIGFCTYLLFTKEWDG